ncbi:tetratricopeptide repeat protein [Synechococcus moorigangaii CMS01]|nr:tetratricopeptide repeat protein [Synechococcus moorigangaii CMS01]
MEVRSLFATPKIPMNSSIPPWIILGTILFLGTGTPGFSQTTPVPETSNSQANAIERYNAGVDALTQGNFQGAIAEFSAAISLDNSDPDAYYNRGYSYHVLGEYQAAYDDYSQAIQLKPEFADAYGNRCYAAYLLDNYEQAIADCDQAIILKNDNPDFFINRGNAYDDLALQARNDNQTELANGYHAKAIADYNAALTLRPNYPKAHYNRALAHNRFENHNAALQDYTASLVGNPDFAEAYYNRAITHYKLADLGKAIADMEQAVALFSQQNKTTYQTQAEQILAQLQAQL